MAKRRKPGSGNQIGDHLWEGRYSPGGPDGKQSSRNVYGHTPEECEEKLRVLIAAMKAKKETPADAGVFLSVVFLWSIKNSKNLEHCKCTKKLQKAKKLLISQEIRSFLVETTGLELLIDLFLCCLCMFFCTNSANLGGFLYQIALPSTLGYPWLKGKIRVTASSCHEPTGSALLSRQRIWGKEILKYVLTILYFMI